MAFAQVQHEASLLAQLRHPNVAQFFDAVLLQPDRLAIIMEWIDGEPVNIALEKATTKEILRQVMLIAEAVAFSHNRRILHGDIKPSNILINAAGEPKLLDFGIGVMTNSRAPTRALGMTEAFASPELQASGLIESRDDAYSLGKLLACLLQRNGKGDEAGKRSKDLEAVLLKSEARGYDAHSFASEIKRLLAGSWVEARNQERFAGYKALARRRPWALAATAFVMVSWMVGSVALYGQRNATELARVEAVAEAQSAAQTSDFLIETIRRASPEAISPEALTVRDLAMQADRMVSEAELAPRIQVRLLLALAELDRASARHDEALSKAHKVQTLSQQEETTLAARRVQLDTLVESGRLTEADEVVAKLDASDRIAIAVSVARFHLAQGEFKEAAAFVQSAADSSSSPRDQIALLLALATAQNNLGEFHAADATFGRIDALSSSAAFSAFDRFNVQTERAGTLRMLGRVDEAEALGESALSTLEQVFGEAHPTYALAQTARGYDLYYLGEYARALSLAESAKATLESHFSKDYFPRMGEVYDLLGKIHAVTNNTSEAVRLLEFAIASLEKAPRASQRDIALLRYDLASYLSVKRRYDESLKQLQLTKTHFVETTEPNSLQQLFVDVRMMNPLHRLQRYDEGMALATHLMPRLRAALPPNHQGLIEALADASALAHDAGEDAIAVSYAREAAEALLSDELQAHPALRRLLLPKLIPALEKHRDQALIARLQAMPLDKED